MTIRLDAQLSPSVAEWIQATSGIECRAARELGLRDAKDASIFQAARDAGAVMMTKDKDFVELLRLTPRRFSSKPHTNSQINMHQG